MSIVQADIVAYAAASMPLDDTSVSGGAIDTKTRVSFTDLAANDEVEVISDSASDTMNVTVTGRLASGVIASQTVAVNGTTAVLLGDNAFERIMSITLSADAIGNVTVRRQSAGATIATIPAGERGITRLFYNAASDPSSAEVFYEKFFWKNNNATLAYLNATVSKAADPSNTIDFALATAVNDTSSVTNRKTAPAGLTFDDLDKEVPGTNLNAGDAVGVWLKMSLSSGQDGFKANYTSRISGTSV